MNFDDSPVRSALIFSRVYEKWRHQWPLTKKQILFLCFIVENGHSPVFLIKSLARNGVSCDVAYQYLRIFQKKGFIIKKPGYRWELTQHALNFYAKFHKEFFKSYRRRNFWT